MARQERATRTRAAILEAAASVFAERGYEAATIADILARADVTKGALYFHFSSKEDLARGVLAYAVTTEGVPEQPSKLQEVVDVSMVLAHRLPREAMLRAASRLAADQSSRELFGAPYSEWTDLVASLLSQAKAQGELLPHVLPDETAAILVGAFTGLSLTSQESADISCLEHQVGLMYDHMLPAIAVPGILGRLDTRPGRGARVTAQAAEDDGPDQADDVDDMAEEPLASGTPATTAAAGA
ncbi:TetR/AcrR family transcriptional regulator [Streptomyces sp. ISL-10]|uniref:ScbR family autoregulator-binding transcription factor n=1 Tax=Streptomyces sp. ISL-10 TaxID=2819172 RepID=UPI001BE764A5|nr:ScbR family autoregulator-binding transcription factor [Streptomyces sp. ISL-10]MBT2369081.1 TetR/AcrR family transcriptional regulator [Streptomyces sp. ISL-10]